MKTKITKAVVLCGGLGTRFLPISKSVPKEMLPVINKPIIQYIIEELVESGVTEILIVLGRGKDAIINHFDKNIEVEERLRVTDKYGELNKLERLHTMANIYFARQIEPRGTGHGVMIAKNFANEPFILHYGDELFVGKASRTAQLLEAYYKLNSPIIGVKKVQLKDACQYGIIKPIAKKNIHTTLMEGISEKPKGTPPSDLAFIGSCVLTPEIFAYIEKLPQENLEIPLTDAISNMASEHNIYALNLKGTRLDVGSPNGLIDANIFVRSTNTVI